MQNFKIEEKTQVEDGIGGFVDDWKLLTEVNGLIDLLTGTNLNAQQNAFIEQSTHVLVIPDFKSGITEGMRVVDVSGRIYSITYSDDPVGLGHHNELYCKFEGVEK